MLGYDNDENGDLIINEQEAFIVRKIYSLYLEGNGLTKIVKWLNDNNYKTISGKDRWHISTISGILQNEKYTGNALLQKHLDLLLKTETIKLIMVNYQCIMLRIHTQK